MEVNYAAAAYDELKMCKSRMEIFDPDIEETPTKSKLKVSKYEVIDVTSKLLLSQSNLLWSLRWMIQ